MSNCYCRDSLGLGSSLRKQMKKAVGYAPPPTPQKTTSTQKLSKLGNSYSDQ